jgi:hypothetical protein
VRKVIALKDYEARAGYALSFKTGDIIEMLEEDSSNGWCLGRKNGEIGLYLPSYVTGIYMIFLLHRINLDNLLNSTIFRINLYNF